MSKNNLYKNDLYEISFKKEIIREASIGVVHDLKIYLKEHNDKSLEIIKDYMMNIYLNIFNPEYNDMELLDEIMKNIKFSNMIIKSIRS